MLRTRTALTRRRRQRPPGAPYHQLKPKAVTCQKLALPAEGCFLSIRRIPPPTAQKPNSGLKLKQQSQLKDLNTGQSLVKQARLILPKVGARRIAGISRWANYS